MRMLRRSAGFTLIEVMVTVVIVAVLAAVALPSFQSQIRKTRRVDATRALMAVQLGEEKWRSDNSTYTSALSQVGVASTSLDGYYTIGLSVPGIAGCTSAQCYQATATAVAGKSQASDTACSTITLSWSPTATPAYIYGPSAACWGK